MNREASVREELVSSAVCGHYRSWLFDAALPFWWEMGANRGAARGFHDKLHFDGRHEPGPQRLRVQARQIFAYAEAGRLGWPGPWAAAMEHGASAMLGAHRREDGLFRAEVDGEGRVVSDHVDLYDQTFVLLALASMWRAGGRLAQIHAAAAALFDRLRDTLAHAMLGFEEARPRRLPLRANPHMHLLEACLAWVAAGEGGMFADAALDIIRLARDHLIDRESNSIGEFFDGDWLPAPGPQGALREPGHQFEWAFLLAEAESSLGVDLGDVVARLYSFATAFGIADGRVVAATDPTGVITDRRARLWPQTERLRASITIGKRVSPEPHRHILQSLDALETFLPTEHPGWWIDRLTAEGVPVMGAAPASSLYHLMTGLGPLLESRND